MRKADAERAIERMQGFPIGGSRIRLSWGRSQCEFRKNFISTYFLLNQLRWCSFHYSIDKAAQAAAQAAQAAQAVQAEQVARYTATAASAVNAQNPASLHITPDQALQLLQSAGYNMTAPGSSLPSEEASGFLASQPFHDSSARRGSAFSASETHEFTNTFMPSENSQRSTFSPFSPASNVITGADEQQYPTMTPSPSQPLPHPSRSYAPGFGPSPSSVSGKYSDTHSPHSSSTESSSGSSSVRFSGIGNGSSGFPSAAFLEKASGTFQVNDILRHDSHTLHPRVTSSSTQPQDPSARTTPPRHQQRHQTHNGLHLRDDTSGSEFMHDLNGTLASLDLGERYPRAPIGSAMLMKDGYGHNGDSRPLSKSISAPLKSLGSPRHQSGGSPDST